MNASSLYSIVQDIDEQIGSIKFQRSNAETIKRLLELRNNLIQKYLPSHDYDWTIHNKKAQEALRYFQWDLIWK